MSESASTGEVKYRVGTLEYTKRGLMVVFLWLLWEDCCFTFMITVEPAVLPIVLKSLRASDVIISTYIVTFTNILNLTICPISSFMSDRYRSKWGRRIPFLAFATPFVGLFLILTGYCREIGSFSVHALLPSCRQFGDSIYDWYSRHNADMAEALFWDVLDDLMRMSPGFALGGRQYCGVPRRFKRVINVVDSSTIKLVANCLDWAKHRRRKAAAKMHLRLDLHSFLPKFVLVKSASTNDLAQSYEVCAGVRSGEIVVFDKAYVGYEHLCSLTERGVFWVTRAKENTQYEAVGQHTVH